MRWPLHDHLEIYAARVHETKRYLYNTLHLCFSHKHSFIIIRELLFLGSIRSRYLTSNESDVCVGDGDDDGDGDGETSEKQLDEAPQLHEVR